MKKSIIALLTACVLVTGTSAFAATSSLVGKKVAKEVVIEKNGVKSAKKAVIIDGVTYAPVRDIAEGAGYSVTYKGDVISLETVAEEVSSKEVDILKAEVSKQEELIKWYQFNITNTTTTDIANLEQEIAKENARIEKIPGRLTGLEANLKERRTYVSEQQALIDAAQAKITELQAEMSALNK